MPIRAPAPPPAVLEAIRRSAGRSAVPLPRALTRLRPGPARSLTVPQQVFTARLDALAQAKGLEASVDATGWRMLVEERGEVVAAAEVHGAANAGGRPPARAQLDRGPFVRATVDVLTEVEQGERVLGEDFELRLLRVPALHLTALWLRGGNGDLVVPLPPVPAPFEAHRPYEVDAFTAQAADAAREVLEAYRRAEHPDALGG